MLDSIAGFAFIYPLCIALPTFLFNQDLVDQGKVLRLILQLFSRYECDKDCQKVPGLPLTHLTNLRSGLQDFLPSFDRIQELLICRIVKGS